MTIEDKKLSRKITTVLFAFCLLPAFWVIMISNQPKQENIIKEVRSYFGEPFIGPIMRSSIGAPIEVFKLCEEKLGNSILKTFKDLDQGYIERIVPIVCQHTWDVDVSSVKYVAIMSTEHRWIEQRRDDAGRYIPSPTSDFGPCQINIIHKQEFGTLFMYNEKENIRVGTIIFARCRSRYGCYNGGGTAGYSTIAARFERRLKGNI